jgi:hypothetical protein
MLRTPALSKGQAQVLRNFPGYAIRNMTVSRYFR